MKQERYKLEEAIKNFYTTEPLKVDLATSVTNKIFKKDKKTSAAANNWLYILIGFLIAVGIVYSVGALNRAALSSVFTVIVLIVLYFSLSFKEYSIMHKKLLQ